MRSSLCEGTAVLAATLICALAAMPGTASAAAAVATGTIHVEQPGARIDRHLYGQFAEHLGRGIQEGIWVGEDSPIPNIRGFRKDVIAALRELKVPVVRWPGGCFADEYHWRDGIGPRAARPVTLNTNWGGVPEDNSFGTHEFLDFVELIGADAYINGNVGTGSPREMAEWLQYLTSDKPTALTAERTRNGHPAPWKIAYFAVGNETWGCGGNMSSEHYVDVFRQYATFLKAPEGARPVILASGGHDEDVSWSEALISKGGRDVDEWGTWYDTEPGREPGFLYQQNSLRDAIVAAVNFTVFHRHADRVRMANIAQMVNVLQAMILTRGATNDSDPDISCLPHVPAIPGCYLPAGRPGGSSLHRFEARMTLVDGPRGFSCDPTSPPTR